MKNIPVAIAGALFLALTGCSSTADTAKETSKPTNSKTTGDPATGDSATGDCSAANARATRGLTVTNGRFDITCAKVSRGRQMFIVNGSAKKVTVSTAAGAPERFTVELPKRTSTYAWTPKTEGTYTLTAIPGSGKATVVVR